VQLDAINIKVFYLPTEAADSHKTLAILHHYRASHSRTQYCTCIQKLFK